MSFMTWIKLTAHWIINDCDLEKVSICTPSKDCVRLHTHVVGWVCAWNFGRGGGGGGGGGDVKPRENLIF